MYVCVCIDKQTMFTRHMYQDIVKDPYKMVRTLFHRCIDL